MPVKCIPLSLVLYVVFVGSKEKLHFPSSYSQLLFNLMLQKLVVLVMVVLVVVVVGLWVWFLVWFGLV
jgi:hypothetical protein